MQLHKRNRTYLQEATIFISMFILTMLHEWMSINTLMGFFKGFVFFLLIYAQAQVHRFFIFPLFLKKQTFKYALLTLAATATGAAILLTANKLWLQPECFVDDSLLWVYIYHFVICIISTFTIISLSLMQSYSLELQKRNSDQLLLNEMNLKHLHLQLNPHFFFNMLNNLYGVSLTNAERTPSLIIKLSDLMRYQIENANSSTVKLSEEIAYIRNYVDLEKERIGKRCDIKLREPEENLADNYRITPLLLIILIENAFKHSVGNEHWFVHIDIKLENGLLDLEIHNSLPKESMKQKSTGIGLSNIKQRLAMLYKDKYELKSSKSEYSYRTTLFLNLEG